MLLSEKLREKTSDFHQQTEVMLVRRIKAVENKTDYAVMLGLFYSYFGGLEKLIDNAVDSNQMPDYKLRRKTAALKADIEYLNGIVPDLAPADALPAITTHTQAIGALYVIEGSTLGGKIISKMITQKLMLDGQNGFTFFNGYGAETDTMWTGFKNMLNNFTTAEDQKQLIDAANNTFLCFKDWLKQYYLTAELDVEG